MDQLINLIIENGITSPVVIIVLGAVCIYFFKKYERAYEQNRKTQHENYLVLSEIRKQLEDSNISREAVANNVKQLQNMIHVLELQLNNINGKNTCEVTSIIKDIDAIKRFLEMCYIIGGPKDMLRNKSTVINACTISNNINESNDSEINERHE